MSLIHEFKSECRLQTEGRTSAKGLWTFALGYGLLNSLCFFLFLLIAGYLAKAEDQLWFILSPSIYLCLYLTLVSIFVTIRRLHDMGYSGWWFLLIVLATVVSTLLAVYNPLFTVIGYLAICLFLNRRSDVTPNQFG